MFLTNIRAILLKSLKANSKSVTATIYRHKKTPIFALIRVIRPNQRATKLKKNYHCFYAIINFHKSDFYQIYSALLSQHTPICPILTENVSYVNDDD